MAVLVEATSVIARREKLEAAYPGGWAGFVADCPNRTLCADRHLARIGFMSPADVEAFVHRLEAVGMAFLRDGATVDIAVVDQMRGPTRRSDWLDWGHVDIEDRRVATCRLAGDTENRLITPDGWQYEKSLSATCGFVPNGAERKSLKFLRHEDGLDVYLSRLTGKEVFIGRAFGPRLDQDQTSVFGGEW
jgi:hypothetical protein